MACAAREKRDAGRRSATRSRRGRGAPKSSSIATSMTMHWRASGAPPRRARSCFAERRGVKKSGIRGGRPYARCTCGKVDTPKHATLRDPRRPRVPCRGRRGSRHARPLPDSSSWPPARSSPRRASPRGRREPSARHAVDTGAELQQLPKPCAAARGQAAHGHGQGHPWEGPGAASSAGATHRAA